MRRVKRNGIRACILVLGVVLLAACQPDQNAERPAHGLVVADVILTVVNTSDHGMQVSVESDTLEYLLGAVEGRASRSFSLPSSVGNPASRLRFKAVADGAPPLRSNDFHVRRGEKVVWTLGHGGRGTTVKR